ncbi:hypothetical protein [Streptomyces sp. S1D4-23]|uniref:hypothetical protein n=1 Tax=Streptomyces sp. S1D4-23 TaxID=2594463 RepID=UPI001F0851D2|nr:hypothetical protein [Streptomyces sp. S1D4-23]
MELVPARMTGVDAVTVRPGRPLAGTVRADGSKNAALPLLAAAASLRRGVHLSGVPASADVQRMLGLLEQCGYRVAHPVAEPGAVIVMPKGGPIEVPELGKPGAVRWARRQAHLINEPSGRWLRPLPPPMVGKAGAGQGHWRSRRAATGLR